MNRTLGRYIAVSEWEYREIVKRVVSARCLPRGERTAVMRSIAADYGLSVRTLHRYAGRELTPVRVGRHSALFLVDRRMTPRRVTAWEEAA